MWAAHDSAIPLDYREHYFDFELSYRLGCGGNPANSFTLDAAHIREHPPLGTPKAQRYAGLMHNIERANAHDRELDMLGFVGIFMCSYRIDNEHEWVTSANVNERQLPTTRPSRPWYFYPQWCAPQGIVYRLIGEGSDTGWALGQMEKDGRKWVWKQRNKRSSRSKAFIFLTVMDRCSHLCRLSVCVWSRFWN
ncbi:hypothetical protein B0H10DRAFT_1949064 [Mycena sp. CBHHK59/15]|nr:hypothetical protein B0H10DRAFT_1949064 [Mycena sp. CBHHK59/15]